MTPTELPQILRIKRKRNEDPLQALLFQERKIKRPRFVFKLQRTEENDIDDHTTVLETSDRLSESKGPVFNLPKRFNGHNPLASHSDPSHAIDDSSLDEGPQELNPQLLEMLNDYLKDKDETVPSQPVKPPKRRQSSISQNSDGRPRSLFFLNAAKVDSAIDDTDDDYVYDVYYRDKAVMDQLETEKIGYIKFADDDLGMIEEDEGAFINTDDEDSNDENFYRNDYPDDEDGGYEKSDLESMGLDEPSDDQDDEFDILNNKRRFSNVDYLQTEGLNNMSHEDMSGIYKNIMEQPDPWNRINREAQGESTLHADGENDMDIDVDMDAEEEEEDNYERQRFFQNDDDDPIAKHRDKIFGKLQRMIDDN
ncbi:Iwr1 protein [Martiniozyma asiatica (nom. inval.)]|nr:Iwr1 protein [Martiniozyma asiatica]